MSRSITHIVLEIIEDTRQKYFDDRGKTAINDKKDFIDWYVKHHEGPIEILIYDLKNHYLHISQSRILRYMNE